MTKANIKAMSRQPKYKDKAKRRTKAHTKTAPGDLPPCPGRGRCFGAGSPTEGFLGRCSRSPGPRDVRPLASHLCLPGSHP